MRNIEIVALRSSWDDGHEIDYHLKAVYIRRRPWDFEDTDRQGESNITRNSEAALHSNSTDHIDTMAAKGASISSGEKPQVEMIEDQKLALENTNSVMTDDLSSDTSIDWDPKEEKKIV